MAQVWLSRRDCLEGTLPPLCLKCGEPASECVEKELWVLWAGSGQSVKLRVPMCPKHCDYWRRRRVNLCLLLVVVGLSFFAGPALYWLAEEKPFDLDGLASIAFLVFVFVLIYLTSGIRVKEIHEGGVLLFGVSLKFAHTYEGEHFLGGVDVDEALDKYARLPRRSKDVTDEG